MSRGSFPKKPKWTESFESETKIRSFTIYNEGTEQKSNNSFFFFERFLFFKRNWTERGEIQAFTFSSFYIYLYFFFERFLFLNGTRNQAKFRPSCSVHIYRRNWMWRPEFRLVPRSVQFLLKKKESFKKKKYIYIYIYRRNWTWRPEFRLVPHSVQFLLKKRNRSKKKKESLIFRSVPSFVPECLIDTLAEPQSTIIYIEEH